MEQIDVLKLVTWYQKNKRDLPWRHTKDSYKIWISEVMLQQTRVEAVREYYRVFIEELPNISDLANVLDDKLMKLWEGLGYYNRARNLKKCASILVNQGKNSLPDNEEELSLLPGIGPYTMGAILSIAYLKPVPAVDGNVIRVLSRVLADGREVNSKIQKEYFDFLKKFIHFFPSDDFTQSFIELGALVCVPKGTPKCRECPLKNCCVAHKENKELEFPKKKIKKKRKIVEKTVIILKFENTYSILKREEGVLQGMYEFPNVDISYNIKDIVKYLGDDKISFSRVMELGEFKHIFTHLEWHMKTYLVEIDKKMNGYLFATKDELNLDYSIPSAFQKMLQKL